MARKHDKSILRDKLYMVERNYRSPEMISFLGEIVITQSELLSLHDWWIIDHPDGFLIYHLRTTRLLLESSYASISES